MASCITHYSGAVIPRLGSEEYLAICVWRSGTPTKVRDVHVRNPRLRGIGETAQDGTRGDFALTIPLIVGHASE